MTKYYIAIYSGAILTVLAQLLLKKGALKKNNKFISLLINPFVIIGYLIFIIVSLLNLYALKEVNLILMVTINPIIHILVISSSIIIFKEKLTRKQVGALIIIIMGIILFNFS